ncbi:MAG TPA: hypothetical protein VIL74_24885 [Pyrinomonadaceae bacterium]|jgi:hypothetical protein
MITAGQIAEILSLYKRHGWTLRRVLLSDALRASLAASAADLFGAAEIRASDIDAAWFSRPSKADQEAWELRRLSETPLALMEIFDAEDEDEVREETLAEVEARLKNFRR